jgi:hypothetical protein
MGEEKKWQLELYYENQDEKEQKDHFYYPLYLNCYEEAIRNICMGVLRERKLSEKLGDKYSYVHQNNDSRIISFFGGRGTGKSTAMAEFCYILNRLEDDSERRWWIDHSISRNELREQLYEKKLNFKILNIIEASNLEDKEDLFELIMASIFRQWEEKMRTVNQTSEEQFYQKTEFQKRFNSIMNGYYALKNARSEEFGDSYISKLKTMSSSMDIREKIRDLIDSVLALFYGNSGTSFLVIAIDDLDLNIAHGYEMLEQLHKYFFLPNVWILMSGDYDQIGDICTCSYVKEFSGGRSHVIEKRVVDHCGELSRDYISKILPVDLCVYMPELQKNFKKIVVNGIPLKSFLMCMIAEKMYIHYDICGVKMHFTEAHTVRELVHYFQFLDSLAVIDFAKWMSGDVSAAKCREYMNLYDKNHEQFNHDLRHRMANNFLSEKQKKVYWGVLDKSLEERAVEACKILRHNEIFRSLNYLKSMDDEEGEKYTYGDLIQEIYEYGRRKEKNEAFVECLLASFTSEMVREKINSIKNPDAASRSFSVNRMNQFLGKTAGNRWLGNMVPMLEGENDRTIPFGYDADGSSTLLEFSFELDVDILNELREHYVDGRSHKNVISRCWKYFKAILEKNRVIPTLECMAMFLIPHSENTNWVEFTVSVKEERENPQKQNKSNYILSFKGKNESVVFDILGFVKKSIDYKAQIRLFLGKLIGSIVEGIFAYLSGKVTEESIAEWGYLLSMVQETVYDNSLFLNSTWQEDGGAFPFYDFDLAYNVLKSTRRERLEKNPETTNKAGCYNYVRKAYKSLYTVLRKQDVKYGQFNIPLNYAERLKSYPFMEAFLNAEKKLAPGFETLFGENIYKMLLLTVVSETDHPEAGEQDDIIDE